MNRKETPKETAVREVREEVGIEIANPKYLGTFVSKKYREDTVHAFSAKIESPYLKIDPGEILEAKWFSPEEISNLKLSFIGKKMFEMWKASQI